MSSCSDIQPWLVLRPEDWPSSESRRIQVHLASCPHCAAKQATYAQQDALIQALPAARLTPAQHSRFVRQIHGARRKTQMFSRMAGLAMVTVVVLMLLGVYVLVGPHQPAPVADEGSLGTGLVVSEQISETLRAHWETFLDPKIEIEKINVWQRQAWAEGEILLLTFGNQSQTFLEWALLEPAGEDALQVTDYGLASGQPLENPPFWMSLGQDSAGQPFSVVYRLAAGLKADPENVYFLPSGTKLALVDDSVTTQGAVIEILRDNQSFLYITRGDFSDQYPKARWLCGSELCSSGLRWDGIMVAEARPEPLIFAGEIQSDVLVNPEDLFEIMPFPVGDSDTPQKSAAAWLEAPGTIEFSLPWRVVAAPSADWVVFVHLLDAAGQLLTQNDVQVDWDSVAACQETGYMHAYDASCAISSSHRLMLPADLPSDFFQVWIGLYNRRTAERARPGQAGDFLVDNEMVLLGRVYIEAMESSAQ